MLNKKILSKNRAMKESLNYGTHIVWNAKERATEDSNANEQVLSQNNVQDLPVLNKNKLKKMMELFSIS